MMDPRRFVGNVDINSHEYVDIALKLIVKIEEEINIDIMTMFSKQCHIETKMNVVGRAMSSLNIVGNNSNKLNKQIVHTAHLADSVSAKVRNLDMARLRASECQRRVHDLIDLQLCSQGVLTAISQEDYEKGAGHIRRFLAMDQQLLQRTADDVQDSVTSVSDAVKTLENAMSTMRELVEKRFDEAVINDDLASVERFFKIFPLIGQHEKGIDEFSKYICMKLSLKAQKELRNSVDIARAEKREHFAYSDTLTVLLENFARVIEVNQPIVEAYYGKGYLLNMLEILQNECDLEVKTLISDYRKSRSIMRRIQQLNEIQRSTSSTGGGMSNLGHYSKLSDGSLDKPNPKDIDTIIAEITVMHFRIELYFRFMRRRVMIDIENASEKKMEKLEYILSKSDLSRQMQELLDTYLLFERYFMEESVIKAIALDTHEGGQQCSSMVDDIFFILRKSIRRSFTTQSINGTCAVINNAASCLDGDFLNVLKIVLKNGYPSGYIDLAQAYNAIQNTLQQGKLQSSDAEKSRNKFIIQLNNADISTEYIETLWQTMEQEINIAFPTMSTTERKILNSCLAEFKVIQDSLKACVDMGMQQLRSSAIKPRLHPWVDQFLNYNHYLTEEELAAYEAAQTFVQFLIIQIDGLLNLFKSALSPRNYDTLVSILATEVTMRLERAIKKTTFNRLGGLVLDQEVRALGSYLTGTTSWSVRDKIIRLTQIATLLNLEKISELSDYWNPESGSEMPSWRITPNEIKTILTLRTDFRMDDIKRIKL